MAPSFADVPILFFVATVMKAEAGVLSDHALREDSRKHTMSAEATSQQFAAEFFVPIFDKVMAPGGRRRRSTCDKRMTSHCLTECSAVKLASIPFYISRAVD